MAEIVINHHTNDTNLNNIILNSEFDINKCWARLSSDQTKQCKNKSKDNCNFCGVHLKGFNKGTIFTIFDSVIHTKSKKNRKRLKLVKKETKIELIRENYLPYEGYIITIQAFYRRFQVKQNIKTRGISIYCRHLCNNDTDCLSLKSILDIPNCEFYSYKDIKGIYWAFDIITIKECINAKMSNPYNTLDIPEFVNSQIKIIEKIIHKEIKLEIPIFKDINIQVQQRCVELFQQMDALKNYTKCAWFLDLNINLLKKLYKEMEDIWNYRLQLTKEDKLKYTKDGKIFNMDMHKVTKITNKYKLSNLVLDEFEKLIRDGKTESDRATACQWILSGLTLVNQDARNTLPWLYQSASY